MNRIFFLFFIFCFVNSKEAEKINKKSTDKALKKEVDIEKEKLSFDMTHRHFVSFGGVLEFADLFVFASLLTVLYSDTYKDAVPPSEYQYSFARNLQFEVGFMYEVIPFFGVSASLFTKEFLNGGAVNLKLISGGRIGVFLHLSRFWIECGCLVKEGHSGIVSFKNHGISLFVSFKMKKDFLLFGGALII